MEGSAVSKDQKNRQWLLASRPKGGVRPDDFRYVEGAVPVPGDGDVLVRSLYFGFDASQRIWLTEDGGYMEPIRLGEPMRCVGIGQVVESRHPDYQPGELVEGFMSWQDYSLVRADGWMPLRHLPRADYPVSWNLGVFGVVGLTAYFGVTDGLKVKQGDVVVISAASGATGALACQVARAMGAKLVIGIAGGADKCRWVVEHAGCDAAIDYKAEDLSARLNELAPSGVDAYFDNVGGGMLDELLLHMAPKGRVLICGAMSSGYTGEQMAGPRNFMRICTQQLTVQGILLFHYADQIPQAAAQLGQWVAQGLIRAEENRHEGFEKAPELLPTMFTGKAPGKLILHIADPV